MIDCKAAGFEVKLVMKLIRVKESHERGGSRKICMEQKVGEVSLQKSWLSIRIKLTNGIVSVFMNGIQRCPSRTDNNQIWLLRRSWVRHRNNLSIIVKVVKTSSDLIDFLSGPYRNFGFFQVTTNCWTFLMYTLY